MRMSHVILLAGTVLVITWGLLWLPHGDGENKVVESRTPETSIAARVDARSETVSPNAQRREVTSPAAGENGVVPPQTGATEERSISELEKVLLGEDLLPKINWDFVQSAGTPDLALANTFLNPDRIALSEAQKSKLRTLIGEHRTSIEKNEMRMFGLRHELVSSRRKNNELEIVGTVSGPAAPMPVSANAEEEVGSFSRGAQEYVFRIRWGEDAAYDDVRKSVYYSKQAAVDAIRQFITSCK